MRALCMCALDTNPLCAKKWAEKRSIMERWNLTMENINDYAKKQSDMCVENDSIPKALYAD